MRNYVHTHVLVHAKTHTQATKAILHLQQPSTTALTAACAPAASFSPDHHPSVFHFTRSSYLLSSSSGSDRQTPDGPASHDSQTQAADGSAAHEKVNDCGRPTTRVPDVGVNAKPGGPGSPSRAALSCLSNPLSPAHLLGLEACAVASPPSSSNGSVPSPLAGVLSTTTVLQPPQRQCHHPSSSADLPARATDHTQHTPTCEDCGTQRGLVSLVGSAAPVAAAAAAAAEAGERVAPTGCQPSGPNSRSHPVSSRVGLGTCEEGGESNGSIDSFRSMLRVWQGQLASRGRLGLGRGKSGMDSPLRGVCGSFKQPREGGSPRQGVCGSFKQPREGGSPRQGECGVYKSLGEGGRDLAQVSDRTWDKTAHECWLTVPGVRSSQRCACACMLK
jgi:hypothetical protein